MTYVYRGKTPNAPLNEGVLEWVEGCNLGLILDDGSRTACSKPFRKGSYVEVMEGS